jgi:hypothetical protein
VRESVPMCCVRERSSAVSISSRMYIGASLDGSRAITVLYRYTKGIDMRQW